ncbi:putative FecR protein [Nitrospira japonica]|uniref:Putative FecR protein n=1 Tax=Nitrospira japonica TaxID=1325564 RepID=A0A1W1IAT6_9BACT|nr:FecR domain-containing protein [Nitrospira japonica]SLM50112.1 putative FecR protein [Nitrospira japonica]
MTEEQASRQALEWLLLLHDRPHDPVLHEQFDAWLTTSDENGQAWDDAQRLWGLIGETPPVHADLWRPKASPAVRSRPAVRRPGRWTRYWKPAVAMVGLAACLVLIFPSIRIYWEADHWTWIGETVQVTLRDGSTVHLSAGSAIRVNDETGVRRVDLLAGEAFFDVHPDPSRPFQVKAEEWTTTVLGTAFDVHLGSQTASVAVERGSVLVDRTGDDPPLEQRLEAGDWVRVERAMGVTAQGHGQPSQVAAWRQGRLIVKSRPIGEVIAELERYHRGVIVVTDSQLKSRLVSGVYDLTQPLEALRAAVQPHQAVVRQLTPYLVIVSSL